MCQYACFPAPKTVTSWTECRFLSSMVDARAVRKAVTSSALMRPVVLPRLSSSVKDPRMEDLGKLSPEMDVCPVPSESTVLPALLAEAGVLSVVDVVLMVESEDLGDCEVGLDSELLKESELDIDRFSTLGKPEVSGLAIVTTLIPWPLMPLAGMKRVVDPSLRFRCVRSGWKSEQQSLASFDVEYQCSASASDCCISSTSSLVRECRMAFTSLSARTVRGILLIDSVPSQDLSNAKEKSSLDLILERKGKLVVGTYPRTSVIGPS